MNPNAGSNVPIMPPYIAPVLPPTALPTAAPDTPPTALPRNGANPPKPTLFVPP